MQQNVKSANSSMPEERAPVAELEKRANETEKIKEQAKALTGNLSDAQFHWRPEAQLWSIGECLAHLNKTNKLYLPILEGAIETGRARGLTGHEPFRHGFLGNFFVRSMEPPPKRKFKAPQSFLPASDQSREQVIIEFADMQERILSCVHAADGLHLGKVKIASPVSKLLRMSLGQGFALLTAHERRHLWQAQQVKSNPNFPRA